MSDPYDPWKQQREEYIREEMQKEADARAQRNKEAWERLPSTAKSQVYLSWVSLVVVIVVVFGIMPSLQASVVQGQIPAIAGTVLLVPLITIILLAVEMGVRGMLARAGIFWVIRPRSRWMRIRLLIYAAFGVLLAFAWVN